MLRRITSSHTGGDAEPSTAPASDTPSSPATVIHHAPSRQAAPTQLSPDQCRAGQFNKVVSKTNTMLKKAMGSPPKHRLIKAKKTLYNLDPTACFVSMYDSPIEAPNYLNFVLDRTPMPTTPVLKKRAENPRQGSSTAAEPPQSTTPIEDPPDHVYNTTPPITALIEPAKSRREISVIHGNIVQTKRLTFASETKEPEEGLRASAPALSTSRLADQCLSLNRKDTKSTLAHQTRSTADNGVPKSLSHFGQSMTGPSTSNTPTAANLDEAREGSLSRNSDQEVAHCGPTTADGAIATWLNSLPDPEGSYSGELFSRSLEVSKISTAHALTLNESVGDWPSSLESGTSTRVTFVETAERLRQGIVDGWGRAGFRGGLPPNTGTGGHSGGHSDDRVAPEWMSRGITASSIFNDLACDPLLTLRSPPKKSSDGKNPMVIRNIPLVEDEQLYPNLLTDSESRTRQPRLRCVELSKGNWSSQTIDLSGPSRDKVASESRLSSQSLPNVVVYEDVTPSELINFSPVESPTLKMIRRRDRLNSKLGAAREEAEVLDRTWPALKAETPVERPIPGPKLAVGSSHMRYLKDRGVRWRCTETGDIIGSTDGLLNSVGTDKVPVPEESCIPASLATPDSRFKPSPCEQPQNPTPGKGSRPSFWQDDNLADDIEVESSERLTSLHLGYTESLSQPFKYVNLGPRAKHARTGKIGGNPGEGSKRIEKTATSSSASTPLQIRRINDNDSFVLANNRHDGHMLSPQQQNQRAFGMEIDSPSATRQPLRPISTNSARSPRNGEGYAFHGKRLKDLLGSFMPLEEITLSRQQQLATTHMVAPAIYQDGPWDKNNVDVEREEETNVREDIEQENSPVGSPQFTIRSKIYDLGTMDLAQFQSAEDAEEIEEAMADGPSGMQPWNDEPLGAALREKVAQKAPGLKVYRDVWESAGLWWPEPLSSPSLPSIDENHRSTRLRDHGDDN